MVAPGSLALVSIFLLVCVGLDLSSPGGVGVDATVCEGPALGASHNGDVLVTIASNASFSVQRCIEEGPMDAPRAIATLPEVAELLAANKV